MKQVNAWHIAIVGPLLYYIGRTKENTPKSAYIALATLSLSLFFVIRFPQKFNYLGIINSIYYLIWIPLFLYISYLNKNIPQYGYPLIKYLGISTISIHLYILINSFIKGSHKHV